MDTGTTTILTQVLQMLSAALIGMCIFMVKGLFRRIKEVEERQYADRLDLERSIQEIRIETTRSITRLETMAQSDVV